MDGFSAACVTLSALPDPDSRCAVVSADCGAGVCRGEAADVDTESVSGWRGLTGSLAPDALSPALDVELRGAGGFGAGVCVDVAASRLSAAAAPGAGFEGVGRDVSADGAACVVSGAEADDGVDAVDEGCAGDWLVWVSLPVAGAALSVLSTGEVGAGGILEESTSGCLGLLGADGAGDAS